MRPACLQDRFIYVSWRTHRRGWEKAADKRPSQIPAHHEALLQWGAFVGCSDVLTPPTPREYPGFPSQNRLLVSHLSVHSKLLGLLG